MERRLNNKLETYITTFKDSIREKATQLGLSSDVKLAKLESINNGDQQKKSKFSFKPEHLNVNYFFR